MPLRVIARARWKFSETRVFLLRLLPHACQMPPQTLGMRMHFRLCISLLLLLIPIKLSARSDWQIINDYNTIVEPNGTGRQNRLEVNPFISYTNIGSDFGFIGPAAGEIGWQRGQISLRTPAGPDQWAGMWHSMSRLARLSDATMNFSACYPAAILPAFQPRVSALRLKVRGMGRIKLELRDAQNLTLWSEIKILAMPDWSDLTYTLPDQAFTAVKWVNWIVEPDADLEIDRLEMRLESADMPDTLRWFCSSYNKALQCWSPATGLVRDRAHMEDGAFDSVSATGLFVLATAAAAERGVVNRDFAVEVLEKACAQVRPLKGPAQLLPHFCTLDADRRLKLHPGTEYSTIDTALFYFGTLIAAQMLEQTSLALQLEEEIRRIDFPRLRVESGFVSHGFMFDGATLIPHVWSDWGGETALVLLLQRMAAPPLPAKMSDQVRPHQGTGFIAEIQSLLFPDFSQGRADALTGANWLAVRRQLLAEQQAYFPQLYPENPLVKKGFFGLSAGENRHGIGYLVAGVDMPNQMVIHPHYVLMSAAIHPDSAALKTVLTEMEQHHVLTPWGMVENLVVTTGETLPMLGGLNATFEALGAYHFDRAESKETDAIYAATRKIDVLQQALRLFYP